MAAARKRKRDARDEEAARVEKKHRGLGPSPPDDDDDDMVPILDPATAFRALQRSLRSAATHVLSKAITDTANHVVHLRTRAEALRACAAALSPPPLPAHVEEKKHPAELERMLAMTETSILPPLQQRYQDIIRAMPSVLGEHLPEQCANYIATLNEVLAKLLKLDNDVHASVSGFEAPSSVVVDDSSSSSSSSSSVVV